MSPVPKPNSEFSPYNLHKTKWPPYAFSMATNGNVITRNSRTDRRRVFILGGKVGHVTHHERQLFKVKRSKVKVTRSRTRNLRIKGFSIGDARE